jgi:hypothetical protein
MECSCSPLYGEGWASRVGTFQLARQSACKLTGEGLLSPEGGSLEKRSTPTAAWQARVVYQRARSIPMERAVPRFLMSVLTGSHKGFYMAPRAVFGLAAFGSLPEEDQHNVIGDLVGSAIEFGPDRYRKIVAGKSQAEREGSGSFRTRQQGLVWRHSAYDWAD